MDEATTRVLKELDDAAAEKRIAMIGVDYLTHRDNRTFLAECIRRCDDLNALPETVNT